MCGRESVARGYTRKDKKTLIKCHKRSDIDLKNKDGICFESPYHTTRCFGLKHTNNTTKEISHVQFYKPFVFNGNFIRNLEYKINETQRLTMSGKICKHWDKVTTYPLYIDSNNFCKKNTNEIYFWCYIDFNGTKDVCLANGNCYFNLGYLYYNLPINTVSSIVINYNIQSDNVAVKLFPITNSGNEIISDYSASYKYYSKPKSIIYDQSRYFNFDKIYSTSTGLHEAKACHFDKKLSECSNDSKYTTSLGYIDFYGKGSFLSRPTNL